MGNIYKVCSNSSLGYVLVNTENHEDKRVCKVRKNVVFNKGNLMVGDNVILDEENNIKERLERTTLLTRPRIANVDIVLVIISVKEPNYSSFMLDKYLLTAHYSSIRPVIIFSKYDLLNDEEKASIQKEREYYESLGISCFYSSIAGIQDVEKLIELTKNKTICVMGQSGVGKSTMLNKIDSSFSFQEGDYQVIKGRGKHVTKSVTLIPYNNGFIGDTPGFSSFELDLTKADIAENFPGFSLYSHDCKYRDCLHTNEDKNICNVCFRYNEDEQKLKHYSNYTKLLEEAKESIYGRK